MSEIFDEHDRLLPGVAVRFACPLCGVVHDSEMYRVSRRPGDIQWCCSSACAEATGLYIVPNYDRPQGAQ